MKLIKTISMFILLASSLFGNLPKNLIEISTESELKEAAQNIFPGQTVWLLLSLSSSFETRIVETMSTQERWQELKGVPALSFGKYQEIISQENLQIVHQEPCHLFLYGDAFLEWLEMTLAPRLELAPTEAPEFAQDFLKTYGYDRGMIVRLLTSLERVDLSRAELDHPLENP